MLFCLICSPRYSVTCFDKSAFCFLISDVVGSEVRAKMFKVQSYITEYQNVVEIYDSKTVNVVIENRIH